MRWFKKFFFAFTRRERIIFIIAAAGAVISFVGTMGILVAQSTRSVPAAGGEFSEGMVGQPEYVNPVIASSEADLGLVKMTYANMYDLADSIEVSTDTRTWTVRLKENLFWQDGQKVTSDDVVFTVDSIQDPNAQSPLYQSWQGVSVSRVSELEVQFTFANPYAFFSDNLKDLYPVPKHLFDETPVANWRLSDYNLKPVGDGPYQFVSYDKNANGFISGYHLQASKNYSGTSPLIQNFDFQFFTDENTLVQTFNDGQIDGFGDVTPQVISELKRPYNTFAWRTSGYYALFLNQSKNLALQDPAVRQALSASLDRTNLINTVFDGNAIPEYGPIPDGMPYFIPTAATTSADYAASLLDAAGWKAGADGFRAKMEGQSSVPLTITITVPQIDFLAQTTDILRDTWQAIGVQVNINPEAAEDVLNTSIKNRDYESLIFGNVLGASSDLYSFWDSSQRFDPGLNLAIYSNKSVDKAIEDARQQTDNTTRTNDFTAAEQDITGDSPAVFLYSPDFVYVASKNVQGVSPDLLVDPSDRFREVGNWYLNTARVLK